LEQFSRELFSGAAQGTDCLDLETQLARAADEGRPPKVRAVMEPAVCVGSAGRRKKADLLAVADRRDFHAGLPRRGPNGNLVDHGPCSPGRQGV